MLESLLEPHLSCILTYTVAQMSELILESKYCFHEYNAFNET